MTGTERKGLDGRDDAVERTQSCTVCGEDKSLGDFYNSPNRACKVCLGRIQREYRKRPEVRERDRERWREYKQRPDVREKRLRERREYNRRPEVRERRRQYAKDRSEHRCEYRKRPEVRERRLKWERAYNQRPDVIERKRVWFRERRKIPEFCERLREQARKYRQARNPGARERYYPALRYYELSIPDEVAIGELSEVLLNDHST